MYGGDPFTGQHCGIYSCACGCSDGYKVSCTVKGCLKRTDLRLSPFGKVCRAHLEELVLLTEEGEYASFLNFYRKYRDLNAPERKTAAIPKRLTREEKEKAAIKEQKALIKRIQGTLKELERKGS